MAELQVSCSTVREVREIRRQIDREGQGDPEKYYQMLMARQDKLSGRLVCRGPKLLASARKRKGG